MKEKEINNIHDKLYELLIELERIAGNNKLQYNLAYGTALGAVRENGFINWDTDLDIMVTIDHYEKFCGTLELELKEDYCLFTQKKYNNYYRMFNRIGLKNVPQDELHIDIFPMVGAPTSKFKNFLFGFITYLIHMGNAFKNTNIKNMSKKASKRTVIIYSICKIICMPVPNILFKYLYNRLKTAYPIKDSTDIYSISGPNIVTDFIPKKSIKESEYKSFEELKLPVPKEWDKYLTQIYGDYMTPRKANYYR